MRGILYNPNTLKYLSFFTLMIGCLLVLILITSILWKLYSNFIYKHNSKLLKDIHKKYSNEV